MPSRRNSIELTDAEIRAFLDSHKTLIIVSNGKDGYPHPMPMWFYVDDEGCLYCTTFGKSQKVKNLERDPHATLQIEAGEQYQDLRGAMLECDVTIERDPARIADIGVALIARYSGVAPTPEALAGVRKQAVKRVGLRFTPTRVVSWDHRKLGGAY